MLVKEARWIGATLNGLATDSGAITVLNIGSSTLDFRTSSQPYIEECIFGPLGINPSNHVIHCDLRSGPGVDVNADITDESNVEMLDTLGCDTFLVSNLLEHVNDVESSVANLRMLVGEGHNLIVTGPLDFPYHPDPIDNMFRPTRAEVIELFGGFRLREWYVARHLNIVTGTQTAATARLRGSLGLVKKVFPPPVGIGERVTLLKPVSAWCALLTRY